MSLLRASVLPLLLCFLAACNHVANTPPPHERPPGVVVGGDTLGAFVGQRGTPDMHLVLDVWRAGPGSGMSTPPGSGPCDWSLRVYSVSAASSARPLWDSAHTPDPECQEGRVPHLRTFGAAAILGDSLPPGPYRLAVRLPFRGDTVELPAGVMVLTDDPRPLLKTTSGLRVHARVEWVPSDSGWIRVQASVSNTRNRRVAFEYGAGACSLWVLAYRAQDLTHPVWDSRRASWECASPCVPGGHRTVGDTS
jgi:hypothetical protein